VTTPARSPLDLQVGTVPRFINGEFADHPVYDGFEVQSFDLPDGDRALLAFLSRRTDRLVHYYVDPRLQLDRRRLDLGAGTHGWTETEFDRAQLEVHDDGVLADVRFHDTGGRTIEVAVDDRDGRPRRRAELFLAPVSAGIDHPSSLMLVLLQGFDLVRDRGAGGVVRIDGEEASVGVLPGRRLHRRLLLKYAAPLTVVTCNLATDGPLLPVTEAASRVTAGPAPGSIATLEASDGEQIVRLELRPALPDLSGLGDAESVDGRWRIVLGATEPHAEGAHVITGGTWSARRRGAAIDLALLVTRRWQPGPLPLVERIVTTVVPTFRRWPTTYRWTATVQLGTPPTMRSRWERTGSDRGRSYRRATGSVG
jgi:hypothetical protein